MSFSIRLFFFCYIHDARISHIRKTNQGASQREGEKERANKKQTGNMLVHIMRLTRYLYDILLSRTRPRRHTAYKQQQQHNRYRRTKRMCTFIIIIMWSGVCGECFKYKRSWMFSAWRRGRRQVRTVPFPFTFKKKLALFSFYFETNQRTPSRTERNSTTHVYDRYDHFCTNSFEEHPIYLWIPPSWNETLSEIALWNTFCHRNAWCWCLLCVFVRYA